MSFFFRLPSACCLWFFFSSWDRVSDSLSPFQWGIKPTYLPSALAPPQTTVRTLQTIWVGVLEIVSVAMILEKERRMLVDEEKRLNRVWQRELLVWPRPAFFFFFFFTLFMPCRKELWKKEILKLPEKLSVKLIPISKSGFTHEQLYMLKEQQSSEICMCGCWYTHLCVCV